MQHLVPYISASLAIIIIVTVIICRYVHHLRSQNIIKLRQHAYSLTTLDNAAAIVALKELIRQSPNEAFDYMVLGQAEQELGNYEESLKHHSHAIQLLKCKASSEQLKDLLAEEYLRTGYIRELMQDYAGAIQDYTRAIEAEPTFALAYLCRANTKLLGGDIPGACSDITTSIELVGKGYGRGVSNDKESDYLPYIHSALETSWHLQRRGEDQESEKLINQVSILLEKFPSEDTPWYLHIFIPRANGNNQAALSLADSAIAADSMDAERYIIRCAIRRSMGDIRGALADADEALTLGRALPGIYRSALHERGSLLALQGDAPGAIKAFDTARYTRVPNEPDLVSALRLAFLHRSHGDIDAALKEFDNAIAQNPQDTVALLFRARTRLAHGDSNGAQADFAAAGKLDPELSSRFATA